MKDKIAVMALFGKEENEYEDLENDADKDNFH